MNSFVTTNNQTSPSSSFSNFPSLWSSQLSTQIVLLATQLGLDKSLLAALQQAEEKGDRTFLQSICNEIHELMAVAVKLLQGHQFPITEEEPATARDPNAVDTQHHSRSVPVTSEQTDRLRSILLILHSHLQKAMEMNQDENIDTKSFSWQSGLHWTWSDGSKLDESCHVTTIGAHLSYGYHYVGSGSRIVLTPSTERALVFLVQTVHQGHNTLMNLEEASISISACIYM